ncbi:hypothetical protein D3C73_1101840 [compost metagenome]
MRSASFSAAGARPFMQASAREVLVKPACSAVVRPVMTCMPMRKACSRCRRRTAFMAPSKSPASPASRTTCSATPVSVPSAVMKRASSTPSSACGRRPSIRARRGAKAMTSTTRSNSFGWFRNRACTCTPALRPEKKTANRRKAASGAPVLASAVSSCGASRVNSSRPRAVRVA